MKRGCTDEKVGKLLHAYELGALSDEDAERFEIHLLGCEQCFAEVQQFSQSANILRDDHAMLQDAGKTTVPDTGPASLTGRIRRYLWPDMPLVFRPAVTIVLILLLIYPAYLGLLSVRGHDARTVVSVSLMSARSSAAEAISIPAGKDLVISFHIHDAVPGDEYLLELRDDENSRLIYDESFSDFDEYSLGSILIPNDLMKNGRYRLELTGGNNVIASEPHIFEFLIVKED